MNLYLITDQDEHGDNRDLFVWADDPKEAVEHWDRYYGSACLPCKVTVREAPTTPMRGAVDWDYVNKHEIYA